MPSRSALFWPWILTLSVVLADQLTKRLIEAKMSLGDSVPIIGELIRLTYIHNEGMAFGVDIAGGRLLGFISLAATILVAAILLKTHSQPKEIRWILAAILGGAGGNTIDRLAYGYVIDFMDVDMPNWLMNRWPVFNVADSAVSIGVVLLIISLILQSPRSSMSTAGSPVAAGEKPEEDAADSHDSESGEESKPRLAGPELKFRLPGEQKP